MIYLEKAIVFGCEGENLVGIACLPNSLEKPATQTGVIIIVGGPQYRAGSHRQFVLLARELATAGIPVLRFDYRGMGDSTGDLHNFENVNNDITKAIDALVMSSPHVQKVILWGLCDGASASLIYMHQMADSRVAGLCLVNPWVRSEASLAKTQVKHYYTQRLRQKEFWAKLFAGKIAVGALTGLVRKIGTAFRRNNARGPKVNQEPFQLKMAHGWMAFTGPMLLILSGDDYTAKEFLEYAASDAHWGNAFKKPNLIRHDLAHTDHTFSASSTRRTMEHLCVKWVASHSLALNQLGNKS